MSQSGTVLEPRLIAVLRASKTEGKMRTKRIRESNREYEDRIREQQEQIQDMIYAVFSIGLLAALLLLVCIIYDLYLR